MINVALVGAGAISGSHIEGYLAFPDRCRIVAVADIYPEKAVAQIERYQLSGAVAYDHVDGVIGRGDVGLASVATPPGTHAELAVSLLDAGINVLSEKPMASSLEECDTMLAAAERSDRTLSIVAQNRFRTDMTRLKSVLDAGLAGRILHVQVDSHWWRGHSYYDLWWRGTWESEGGGCTLNHAVHHIDALQWMAGMPTDVTALIANVAHDNAEVEDLSVAILRFASGTIGQITSSVVHHGQDQQLVFQGTAARVSAPWDVYASTAKANGFPERDQAAEARLTAFHDAVPPVAYEGHTGQVDDVLAALEDPGRHDVLIDGRQGRRTLEIITAIYASATLARTVTFPVAPADPFYTKADLLARALRFHEKSASVAGFADNEITTSGRVRPA